MNEDRVIARDLRAYRDRTDRGLPAIEDTARLLRSRADEEGFWMRSRKMLNARPALTVTGALVVIALVLGVVPISYQRTTGQDVALKLAGANGTTLDAAVVGRIAEQFKGALDAQNVRVLAGGADGGASILARVAGGRSAVARQTANAFAHALGAKGIDARAEVTPVKERVSSNVYAYAMGKAIELRVERAGKTTAQMEADIRAQLEAAGIENPQVTVTQEGDKTNVTVEAKSSNPADAEREIKLELHAGGTYDMQASVNRFEVKRTPGMTDADVKAEVERQMREAGVQGDVTVTNGQIQIQVRKEK
jgi:hypothetical protein